MRLWTPPIARWAQREETDRRLTELERLLVWHGPNDPKVRSKVKTEAALIVHIRHYARLAGALLRFSNVCRNEGDNRTAEETGTAAYHLLKQKCDPEDPVVMQLLHEAVRHALRLFFKSPTKT